MNPSPSNADLNAFLEALAIFFCNIATDYAIRLSSSFAGRSLRQFNWALDYFDGYARGNQKPALWIVDENGSEQKLSYDEMSRRSNQVANFFRKHGVRRGDRIIVMLPNVVAMWEVMLASMKLGTVVIPAATLLTPGRSQGPPYPRAGASRDHQRRLHREVLGTARRLLAHRRGRARQRMDLLLGRVSAGGNLRA